MRKNDENAVTPKMVERIGALTIIDSAPKMTPDSKNINQHFVPR